MKPIYLEPDEEITSVIEKIEEAPGKQLAIVVPKNSSLLQSVINLKLLAKQSKKLSKDVIIITQNTVGQKLAKEVGLQSYAHLGNIRDESEKEPATPKSEAQSITETLPGGIPINRYIPPQAGATPEIPEEEDLAEEPVVHVSSSELPEEKPSEAIQEIPEESSGGSKKMEVTIGRPRHANLDGESDRKKPSELPSIVHRGENFHFKIPWKSVLVAGALIILALIIMVLFIPKANVNIILNSPPIDKTITLNAKIEPDIQDTTITGSLLTSEQSANKTINSTGKKNVGTKATGTITITNKYRDSGGSGKDESFAAGTIATDAKTGKTFALNDAVSVGRVTFNSDNGSPIYQSKSANITAANAGEDYNLPPASFSIANALASTEASSSTAFSGGTTKQVNVLTQDDLDKAFNDLIAQTTELAKTDINSKAQSQKLLDGSTWQTVKEKKSDKQVNDQVDSATVNVIIDYSAIVFDSNAALDKLKNELSKGLTQGQELIMTEGKEPTYTFKQNSEDKKAMTFDLSGQGLAGPKLGKTEYAKQIRGKSISQAQDLLKASIGADTVEITINPGWWIKRVPFFSGEIDIHYTVNVTSK